MTKPFRIDVPQARLDAIRTRVANYDWGAVPDARDWSDGTPVPVLRDLADHWLAQFDWRAVEAEFNAIDQFISEVDGQRIHWLRAGRDTGTPVLLLHGWPSSVFEYRKLWPLLADSGLGPIIVPSLPGYGFSMPLAEPRGPRATARLFHGLMQALGHRQYLIHGGDWGSVVGAWMAFDHPDACHGLHLNMISVQAADTLPSTPEEKAQAERRVQLDLLEGGYSKVHSTKPQSLAYAMMDSPVGIAAWILEKFAGWSDLPRPNGMAQLEARYSKDELLANIMLYLVSGSFATSIRMYRSRMLEGAVTLPAGEKIGAPTGYAAFNDPLFPSVPRSQVAKSYNLVRWTQYADGGHFPAMEVPDLLAGDILAFARQL